MKRAIFKFGEHADLVSNAEDAYFRVEVDVQTWTSPGANWDFPFFLLEDGDAARRGTTLTVTQLSPRARQQFGDQTFIAELVQRIRRAHYLALESGISISVNDQPLEQFEVSFVVTDSIKPFKEQYNLNDGVTLDITAGVGASDPKIAGWYVFCGDRMVLAADQSQLTGWGEVSSTGQSPRFHNQFSRFRGVARFTAKDQSFLPWNTTKRGVDASDLNFQIGRGYMVSALKEVVKFMNELDREIDREDRPLRDEVEEAVISSKFAPFQKVEASRKFVFPVQPSVRNQATISYKIEKTKADRLKQETEQPSLSELGKFCFDFAYEEYIGEDD
jgi:hypothetical protein